MPEGVVYDPLRRKNVAATPEEQVRQWFIGILSGTLGVPHHMMMSEVPMKYGVKSWRADIVVWGQGAIPLAVVECKRPGVDVDADVARQALRYNAVLGVKFIILTNGGKTSVFKRGSDGFSAMDHLPLYDEMNKA